jgi:CDP-diacylglycerol---glycerol-3-phosphate 3-phosphatidyltransferase
VTGTERIALLLVALLLLTMPLFALLSRGRPMDADVARRPTTVILGFWVRDWLMWVIAPLERGFVKARVSPDVFNYLGVAFGIAAGVAFAVGALALGGWMVLLGGAADIFDGRVARARGIASERGAFLDSTLDRFAETFAFVGLAVFYEGMPWATAAVALALGASLLVSYTRARGEALGVQCRGGVMQRAERLVLLAVAALLDPPISARMGWPAGTVLVWAVAAIAVGALGTAVYRTARIAGDLQKGDQGEG